MVGAYEAVVSILKVRLKGNHSFLCNVSNLLHQVTGIFSFSNQVFKNSSKKLFRRLIVILEFIGRCFVFLGVLIQTKVSEMHIQIFDISMIWFLIVVCAETGETFVIKIGLDRINSPNKDIKSEIKFLSV